jgi:hypothetical protein
MGTTIAGGGAGRPGQTTGTGTCFHNAGTGSAGLTLRDLRCDRAATCAAIWPRHAPRSGRDLAATWRDLRRDLAATWRDLRRHRRAAWAAGPALRPERRCAFGTRIGACSGCVPPARLPYERTPLGSIMRPGFDEKGYQPNIQNHLKRAKRRWYGSGAWMFVGAWEVGQSAKPLVVLHRDVAAGERRTDCDAATWRERALRGRCARRNVARGGCGSYVNGPARRRGSSAARP